MRKVDKRRGTGDGNSLLTAWAPSITVGPMHRIERPKKGGLVSGPGACYICLDELEQFDFLLFESYVLLPIVPLLHR